MTEQKITSGGYSGWTVLPVGNTKKVRIYLQVLLFFAALLASANGQTGAIHDAARSGDLETIQRLIIKGSDINEKSDAHETPLIIAVLAGQGEIASYLLQRGADVAAGTDSGLTPIHAAAYAGYDEIIRLLVARGADVNGAGNRYGVTPLHLAAEENRVEAVTTLLSLGADVTLVESNGYSAVSRAGWREHWGVVDALLSRGATCQPADKVGDWLYQECIKRAGVN